VLSASDGVAVRFSGSGIDCFKVEVLKVSEEGGEESIEEEEEEEVNFTEAKVFSGSDEVADVLRVSEGGRLDTVSTEESKDEADEEVDFTEGKVLGVPKEVAERLEAFVGAEGVSFGMYFVAACLPRFWWGGSAYEGLGEEEEEEF